MAKGITITKETVRYLEMTDSLKAYLSTLRKYVALSQEEEIELFKRYKNGDKKAGDEIILRNQRFVFAVAKRYATNADEVIDYVNEGNFGLIEAMNNFDEKSGFKFSTFMVNFLRREMYYYKTKTIPMVSKPNTMLLTPAINKITENFLSKNGRKPSETELKELLMKEGKEVKNISDLYDLSIISIDSEIDDNYTFENSQTYNDKTYSVNEFETEANDKHIKNLVHKLLSIIPNEKDRELIKKLYGIGYDREFTITELCEEYDYTEEDLKKLSDEILIGMKAQLKEY